MHTQAMWLSAFLLLCGAARAEDLPPRYDSRHNVERPASDRYATPEDKGRPGEKFYFDAVRAIAIADGVLSAG